MNEKRWIKLYGKLQEKGYYKKSAYVHLWLHLLLKANWKKTEFMWNNKIIIIKEGQIVTGRKELSKETGIPESTIERILEMLENEHQIGQQKTTKYRLITILNWKDYQETDSKRTASGQQADTYKSIKNNKKNTNTASFLLTRKEAPQEEEMVVVPTDEEGNELRTSSWKKARKPKEAKISESMAHLLQWSEERRGGKFAHSKRQIEAFLAMKAIEIKPDRAKARWEEMEKDKFWREKGFDWQNVLNSFDKRA